MTENTINSPYEVMLVDDSGVIRSILKKMLSDVAFVQIIGEAENGKVAIENARILQPDIIILDIEMPVMDGITALPHILQASPNSQIIMFSTLTAKGAEITIKAMSRGAADCLRKPSIDSDIDEFKAELLRKIQALGYVSREKKLQISFSSVATKDPTEKSIVTDKPAEIVVIKEPILTAFSLSFKPSAIAIASSTGGPQALQTVFDGLKNNMPNLPIFITQHMPPVFTKYLANSLSAQSNIECYEAIDEMEVRPGKVYLAPGNFHMLIKADGTKVKIKLNKDAPENFCRPSADPMLRSLLKIYGSKLLVVVLTGMGHDGLLGAKLIAEKGGVVIAQDQASSVVWGMPGAVCTAGITSGIYPIDKIAERIIQICEDKGGVYAPQ